MTDNTYNIIYTKVITIYLIGRAQGQYVKEYRGMCLFVVNFYLLTFKLFCVLENIKIFINNINNIIMAYIR